MRNFAFDLYGTLVDIHTDESSPEFRKEFDDYLFRQCGKEVEFWPYYDALCKGFNSSEREFDIVEQIMTICENAGVHADRRRAKLAAAGFRKLSLKKLAVYPGIKEMLATLKSMGAELYMLSNAQSSFTVDEIDKLGLVPFFDGIELSSDFGYKKPSRLFFEHFIEKYGLEPAQTVFIGNDLNCDVVPAKRAGMCAVYIHTGISPQTDSVAVANTVADYVVDGDINELSQCLQRLLAEE